MKPHLGSIRDWTIREYGDNKMAWGTFVDHPDFAGHYGHTSYIVKHDKDTGEIETSNSRYTLVK
jgi:hypothetical protein